MIIDVKTLSVNAPQNFECSSIRCLPEGYGIVFPCQVKANGKLTKSDGSAVVVEGELIAELKLECGRCLEAVEYELIADFHEEVTKEEGGSTIDISSQVDENIILNIPQKVLCSEECKGLCHNCGANLNNEECSCEYNIDPRFKLLEKLFPNEGGERDGNMS